MSDELSRAADSPQAHKAARRVLEEIRVHGVRAEDGTLLRPYSVWEAWLEFDLAGDREVADE